VCRAFEQWMFTPCLRVTDLSDDLRSSLVDDAALDTVVFVMRMAALELSTNLRLRVNMMGFERQGKTSFVRALFGETMPRDCDRTVGVEIRHMSDVDRGVSSTGAKLPPCAVTLFDFGGHVEYFSLQRSFLVHDCVHVVTVNLADVASSDAGVRQRALHGIGWWLEALCARDVGGVVALLGTHLDEVWGVEGVSAHCYLSPPSLTDSVVLCFQIASQQDVEAAMREVFTTFTALQQELFGDDGSRWQRLGLVAAVSCVPLQQRCVYWRLDSDASAACTFPASGVAASGVKPVLQQLLVAASMHLMNYVDTAIPDRWEAAARVVQSERSRGAVFGEGVWMVPWCDFVTHSLRSLCMRDDVEALAFARHVEKTGAVVLLSGGGGDGGDGAGDADACGGDDGSRPHRWVVCILHDPEVMTRKLLPSREIARIQVARVLTGGATGTHCRQFCVVST
jgi:hypothetical protein